MLNSFNVFQMLQFFVCFVQTEYFYEHNSVVIVLNPVYFKQTQYLNENNTFVIVLYPVYVKQTEYFCENNVQ